MDWITDAVAIGTHLEAADGELLRRHGIRSVLSLTAALEPKDAAALGLAEVVSYNLKDGPNDLRLFGWVVDDLARLLRAASPVLVHCQAGRSRSPAVVAAHFMRTERMTSEEALARIGARRELAVADGLINLLRKL